VDDEQEEGDEEEDDEDEFAFYLFELLDSDGIFAAQVGDAPALRTAAHGGMEDRFDFIDSLQENGFVRIVDYEEVCIALRLFLAEVVDNPL
jgi:hypothetical protein